MSRIGARQSGIASGSIGSPQERAARRSSRPWPEFIRKTNIERFQSLLATSVDDAERRNDTDITDQRSSQGSIAHIQTEDGVNKNVSDADLSNLALSERVTDALRRSLAPSTG
jgi:hypothetical protein